MRKAIEDVYYDRLSMNEQTFTHGSEYDKAISEVAKLEERLLQLLPPVHHQAMSDYSTPALIWLVYPSWTISSKAFE